MKIYLIDICEKPGFKKNNFIVLIIIILTFNILQKIFRLQIIVSYLFLFSSRIKLNDSKLLIRFVSNDLQKKTF